MKLETQRQIILKHCYDNNGITTKEANELCRNFYYCNHEHHISEILSRLVNSGLLVRVKKGSYILGTGVKLVFHDKSQTSLF